MSTLPGPNNAIAYAQFRLQGGLRGTAILAGLCLALLAGLLSLNVVSAVTAGQQAASVTREWPQGLVMLQVVFLLVVGPLRVTSAVRLDVTSRMFESHRLMPVTPAAAVAGYVGGGPWAVIVLAATTFAFGSACCVAGTIDVFRFAVANLAVAAVAAGVSAVTTYLALASRVGILVLVVVGLFAVSGAGSGGPAELMPGLTVLSAPLVSRSLLNLGRVTASLPVAVVALAFHLAVAAICFRAAMRLYRAPGAIGLSPPLGLLLLSVWVAMSAVGLGWPTEFGMHRHARTGMSPADQLVASTVAAMLLAGLPLAAAAKGAEVRRRSSDGPDRTGTVATVATAAAAVALAAALPLLALRLMADLDAYAYSGAIGYADTSVPHVGSASLLRHAQLMTPAVVLATVVGMASLLRLAYRRFDRAWLAMAVWVFAAWVAPLIADTATTTDPNGRFGRVASISPIGALSELWTRTDVSADAGIAMQFAVAAVPAVMYAAAAVRGRRRDATATNEGAPA